MADLKRYTRKEIADTGNNKNVFFIIDNYVYDVSKFIDEHPGGHEVLVNVSGKDASEDFDDVGHSLDAKELMVKYRVGELVDQDKVEVKKKQYSWGESNDKTESESSFVSSWKFPLVLGILVTILYTYLFG